MKSEGTQAHPRITAELRSARGALVTGEMSGSTVVKQQASYRVNGTSDIQQTKLEAEQLEVGGSLKQDALCKCMQMHVPFMVEVFCKIFAT